MSDEYIGKITLEVNGQQIIDFSAAAEGAVEHRKTVQLMSKIGVVGTVPSYPLSLDYVIPKDTPEFDFEGVVNGTVTIDYENGTRKVFSGVYLLTVGETRYESGKEATKTIEFLAMRRTTT